MRHRYNKKRERQILVLRRPDEEERNEVKRIDLRLKRQEEHRLTPIVCGYFKNFGDQAPQEQQEHRWKQTDKPSQRSPPPPKNPIQHTSPAHIRPSQ